MNLMRWEPFEAMDVMFPSFFGGGRPRRATGECDWSPAADISETETEYLIRAALPAVKKEDVAVTFEDGMLTLSGERRQKQEQQDEKFHRVESYYGSFSRTFALPDSIVEDAIKAEASDGMLTVHVPKRKPEEKTLTRIKVQ
jgi:HSP20 family protein